MSLRNEITGRQAAAREASPPGRRVAEGGTPSDVAEVPEAPGISSDKRPSRPHSADIEFLASLTADELRFDESPETEARFFGQPGHESAAGSDRTNLPEKVDPDVTYRNVRVDYRFASRLTGPAQPASEQERPPRAKD